MRRYDSARWPSVSSFAQDSAGRRPSDVGHIGDILVINVDFDRPVIRRAREATIANAEQNGHKTLDVIAYHQIVGCPNGVIEMLNR